MVTVFDYCHFSDKTKIGKIFKKMWSTIIKITQNETVLTRYIILFSSTEFYVNINKIILSFFKIVKTTQFVFHYSLINFMLSYNLRK